MTQPALAARNAPILAAMAQFAERAARRGTLPGRSAARSGALLTRGPPQTIWTPDPRRTNLLCLVPGSAVHRSALHRIRDASCRTRLRPILGTGRLQIVADSDDRGRRTEVG